MDRVEKLVKHLCSPKPLLDNLTTIPTDAQKKSLYERLGGIYCIAPMNDVLIAKVMSNPVIAANQIVHKYHTEMKEKDRVAGFTHLVNEAVCEAAGGPQKYTGTELAAAHRNLAITSKEWRAFMNDCWIATLDEFNITGPLKQELIEFAGGLESIVVTKKDPKCATLYERLGGIYGIAPMNKYMVKLSMSIPTIESNPIVHKAHEKMKAENRISGIVQHCNDALCAAAGGPQKFTGTDLRKAHADLNISREEWNAFMNECWIPTLDHFKIKDPLRQELIVFAAKLQDEVVTQNDA